MESDTKDLFHKFYGVDDECGIQYMQDIILLYEKGIITKINANIGYTWSDYELYVIPKYSEKFVWELSATLLTEKDYENFWKNEKHRELFIKFYCKNDNQRDILDRMYSKISNYYFKFADFPGGVFSIFPKYKKFVLDGDAITKNGTVILKEVPEYFGLSMEDYIQKFNEDFDRTEVEIYESESFDSFS